MDSDRLDRFEVLHKRHTAVITSNSDEIGELGKKIDGFDLKSDAVTYSHELDKQINILFNVTVTGIPFTAGENLTELAMSVFDHIGAMATAIDIASVYRLKYGTMFVVEFKTFETKATVNFRPYILYFVLRYFFFFSAVYPVLIRATIQMLNYFLFKSYAQETAKQSLHTGPHPPQISKRLQCALYTYERGCVNANAFRVQTLIQVCLLFVGQPQKIRVPFSLLLLLLRFDVYRCGRFWLSFILTADIQMMEPHLR